jgi:hypothetical protein
MSVNFMTEEPDIAVPADPKTLMSVFGLKLMEAKFLQAMLATKGWVGNAELPEIKYSKRQVIYTLRQKLDPKGIQVISDGDGRYGVPPSNKKAVKRYIELALSLSE